MPTTGAVTTNIASEGEKFFAIQNLGLFLSRLLTYALILGAILLLAYLVWGGIDWIGSGGDKTKYEEARNKITHALLGMTLLALAWLIWRLVLYFLGIGSSTGSGITLPLPGTSVTP